jgi:septal ring factor EnvC (AmiA/AmiB activator)
MDTLRKMLRDVERDITRCKHNLARIAVDITKLNRTIAKGHYDEAQSLQEREYLSNVGHKKIITEALQRAEAALAASRQKQHPILVAERDTPKGLPASASSYPTDPLGHCLDREVRDLFSLGRKLGPQESRGKPL